MLAERVLYMVTLIAVILMMIIVMNRSMSNDVEAFNARRFSWKDCEYPNDWVPTNCRRKTWYNRKQNRRYIQNWCDLECGTLEQCPDPDRPDVVPL